MQFLHVKVALDCGENYDSFSTHINYKKWYKFWHVQISRQVTLRLWIESDWRQKTSLSLSWAINITLYLFLESLWQPFLHLLTNLLQHKQFQRILVQEQHADHYHHNHIHTRMNYLQFKSSFLKINKIETYHVKGC